MHPEDRVLVAVMSRPEDYQVARNEGWYRVPEGKATPGILFEYVAFYFTAAFGDQKWAVHYYARCLGHELLTRRQLLPGEPDHPRADDRYHKLQLGPLQERVPPIVSLRWRRISFIHTTWDRFQVAREINDLFAEGDEFVDRLYHTLRESGLAPERQYPVREAGEEYIASLAVHCWDGVLGIDVSGAGPPLSGRLAIRPRDIDADPAACLMLVQAEVERRGGLLPPPGSGVDRS